MIKPIHNSVSAKLVRKRAFWIHGKTCTYRCIPRLLVGYYEMVEECVFDDRTIQSDVPSTGLQKFSARVCSIMARRNTIFADADFLRFVNLYCFPRVLNTCGIWTTVRDGGYFATHLCSILVCIRAVSFTLAKCQIGRTSFASFFTRLSSRKNTLFRLLLSPLPKP